MFIYVLLIIFVYINLLFKLYLNNSNNYEFIFWSIFGFTILILDLYTMKKIKGRVLIPYNIFITTSYFFWNGQIILKALNFSEIYTNSLEYFSIQELVLAEIYTVLFMLFFHLGIIVSNIKIRDRKFKDINDKYFLKSINIIGFTLAIVSVVPFILNMVGDIKTSIQYGYFASYNYGQVTNSASGLNNIFGYVRQFFIPALIILFINNINNTRIKKIIIILTTFIIIASFASGGRGGAISLIITFFWICFSDIKRINIKKFILFIILSMIIVSMISIVKDIRDMPNKSLDKIITVLNEESVNKENKYISLISEMGGSGVPLLETMRLIPYRYDYGYGKSYVASIIAVIPSSFMGGFSATKEAALSEWLMKALNLNYGPGYSLIAESYYNFGFFAIGFIVILGIFFGRMLNYNKNIISKINVAIFLYISIMTARDSVYLLIRNTVYFILIPNLLIYLLYKFNNKYKIKY